MKKILFIPLDERPCNYDFPRMQVEGTDYALAEPPRSILGKKKTPGDVDAIWQWMYDNIGSCGDAVISIDTLLYSGIVPSRLHHQDAASLLARLDGLKRLKREHPGLTLSAFSLIMRNPTYSASEEEPDYYEQWGSHIHRYGVFTHKIQLGIASEEEKQQLRQVTEELPKEYLEDYLGRRQVNLQVNRRVIELAAEGVLDFVIIPQDDSSPYGLTAQDQQVVRESIRRLQADLKVYMYPDADAVANTLIARTINRREHRRPLVYVKYASSEGHAVIPCYEDRIVSETVKYQILAAGGLVASSVSEAELVLLVNIPGGRMQDCLQPIKTGRGLQRTIEYDAGRNLVELVEYADYALGTLGKDIIFADVAYCNGGDLQLLSMLKQKGLLWKAAGYAGWNTSSNSLGTCIPMGMIYHIFRASEEHARFLALRYVEDIGFCAVVREDVVANELPKRSLGYYHVDGPHGKIAELVRGRLQKFADEYLNGEEAAVTVEDCTLPWNRMFEAGITVRVGRPQGKE